MKPGTEGTAGKGPARRRRTLGRGLPAIAAVVLCAGVALAWVDTRPGWDDAGITAGAFALIAGPGALVGSGLRRLVFRPTGSG